jgi:hypothetical protein
MYREAQDSGTEEVLLGVGNGTTVEEVSEELPEPRQALDAHPTTADLEILQTLRQSVTEQAIAHRVIQERPRLDKAVFGVAGALALAFVRRIRAGCSSRWRRCSSSSSCGWRWDASATSRWARMARSPSSGPFRGSP